MITLIFNQNCWRTEDNPLLNLQQNSEFMIVGNINLNYKREKKNQTIKSDEYVFFQIESAFEFKKNLKNKNIKCPIFMEDPYELLNKILKSHQINRLIIEQPIGFYEKKLITNITENHPYLEISLRWSNTLFEASQINLTKEDYPKSFSSFRRKIEKKKISLRTHPFTLDYKKQVMIDINKKELLKNPYQCSNVLFTPGENAGKNRVDYYLFLSKNIDTYKLTRNKLLGFNFSSKFSPWLAHGALSPRSVWKEIELYESSINENESTYWLKFELLWREFFKQAMFHYPLSYFKETGLNNNKKEATINEELYKKWCNGVTANEFINANMIELNQTGYMSNRGRQNVASYLIHELNLDWRLGAAYFESKLIDYDVSSNWGNWAYLAGVGNDPRARKFNIEKQQKTYDPENQYTKHWLEGNDTGFIN